MKHYLFFVNQPYSYSILRPLQDEIRARGDDAAWFVSGCSSGQLRRDEKFLTSVDEVRRYAPEAVFAPGDWVPDFFPGIKVQIFHGVARNKRGSHDEKYSDHYRIRGLFDLYCTHADDDTYQFNLLAEKHSTFRVAKTGWPKLDPLFASTDMADDITAQAAGRPIILYASTFSPSVTSAPALVTTIAEMAKHGDWYFLVTLHPKMDPETVDAYRRLAGNNLAFYESDTDVLPLMRAADAMLCDTSSIMFEFMMLDKPVVTYRTRMPGDHLLDVDNSENIHASLEQALRRPPELMAAARRFSNELHEFRDGRSSARVMDAVEDHLSNHRDRLKRKPLNLIRKIKIRKRMGYYRIS